MPADAQNARALDGIRVLDLGQIYNGPYCSLLLADLGADVIKVEPLEGEAARRRHPKGLPYPFLMLNSNKRGITLNLKDARGRQLLRRLATTADVLIENYAPHALDRLGLGYDALHELNPRLVYASGTGFGYPGPYKDYLAMDLTVQAMTGIMAATGYPDGKPTKAGLAVSDFMGGVHLMAAIVAALFQRERTGRGQRIEVAMQDSVLPALASNIGGYFESGGTIPERTGNRHGGLAMCPYNVYPCQDGDVAIFVVSARHWHALCRLLERTDLADDSSLESTPGRVARMDELDLAVAEWTGRQPLEVCVRELVSARVPAAPVRHLDEVIHDPYLRERGILREVTHPTAGPIIVFGSPLRLSDSSTVEVTPAPILGQDVDAVLATELGLTREEIAELRKSGVV